MVIALCSFKLSMFSWSICLTLFSSVYSTSCNMSFIFVIFISLFFFHCPKCYHLTFQWILLSYQILFDLSNFFFKFYISQGLYLLKFIWEPRGVFIWHFFVCLFLKWFFFCCESLLCILLLYFFLQPPPGSSHIYLFDIKSQVTLKQDWIDWGRVQTGATKTGMRSQLPQVSARWPWTTSLVSYLLRGLL